MGLNNAYDKNPVEDLVKCCWICSISDSIEILITPLLICNRKVTGKRVNRETGLELEMPVDYTCFGRKGTVR